MFVEGADWVGVPSASPSEGCWDCVPLEIQASRQALASQVPPPEPSRMRESAPLAGSLGHTRSQFWQHSCQETLTLLYPDAFMCFKGLCYKQHKGLPKAMSLSGSFFITCSIAFT